MFMRIAFLGMFFSFAAAALIGCGDSGEKADDSALPEESRFIDAARSIWVEEYGEFPDWAAGQISPELSRVVSLQLDSLHPDRSQASEEKILSEVRLGASFAAQARDDGLADFKVFGLGELSAFGVKAVTDAGRQFEVASEDYNKACELIAELHITYAEKIRASRNEQAARDLALAFSHDAAKLALGL